MCCSGLDMLKEQENLLLNAEYFNNSPFENTESDTEQANTNNNLIDPSDDLIDIKLQFKNFEKRKLPIVKILFYLNKRPSLTNAPLKS